MKKWFGALLLIIMCLGLSACRSDADNGKEENIIQVYYINREETSIRPLEYHLTAEEKNEAVEELLQLLGAEPSENELKATIFSAIEIYSCRINDNKLIINFSKTYKDMPATTEILVRAAIVRTLTQIEGIEIMEFEIEGESMIDYAGIVVGDMRAEQFIDNEGTEINTYEEVTLTLYFANKEGTALVPVTRKVEYNTNIALEKLVMEQLIKGPGTMDANPTINPATQIINITVNDRICYVNLDQTFLTQVYTVNSEVTVYSIVNSLVELENVNKVQILVNGESAVSYRESIDLNTTFGRNLDLIE